MYDEYIQLLLELIPYDGMRGGGQEKTEGNEEKVYMHIYVDMY
jgi:hypothetical protein